MMRSVAIAVFLMVVGAVMTILNELGILPTGTTYNTDTIVSFDNEGVREMANAAIESEGVLNGLSIFSLLKTIFSALLSALCIAPLLVSWGVSPIIAWALQAPIWFIYFMDFLNWKGNRQLN